MDKCRVNYLLISPNCRYILLTISKSQGSPKTNFTALKEKALKNIYLKLIKIKIFIFERAKVKQSTLVMTFDPNFMRYTW